jgi:hypothetical protein
MERKQYALSFNEGLLTLISILHVSEYIMGIGALKNGAPGLLGLRALTVASQQG